MRPSSLPFKRTAGDKRRLVRARRLNNETRIGMVPYDAVKIASPHP